MKKVRVGVVGMGIGRPNGKALHADPRGRVVALCDLARDRMKDFAKELGKEPGKKSGSDVRLFTDYKKMCRDPEVDAVFVGTPNQLHVPVALEAVRRGKHVMVTKPLSDSLAPARELVEAAEAAGVVNMMSLSTRFAGDALYLGALAREGFFGDVYYARARSVRRSGIPDWSAGFVERGGGALRDMGVHMLDAAWWIMGMPRPASVTGFAGAKFGPRGQGYWDFRTPPEDLPAKYDSDDFGGGFVRFEDGTALQVESFWACHHAPEHQIEIFGTEAGARAYPIKLFKTVNGAPQDATVELPRGPDPWERIARHFIECVLDGTPCDAPLRHGLVVQEMLEGLLESARTGREVRLTG